jgi:mono/diheme cytochrome c family protein
MAMPTPRTLTTLLTLALAAPAAAQPPKGRDKDPGLPARVKEIFRGHCLECHGEKKPSGGVRVFDREALVKKEFVVPGKPDDSSLVQLVTATEEPMMPPAGRPRVNADDAALVRRWVAEGAAPLPADAPVPPAPGGVADTNRRGAEYVVSEILDHVRRLKEDERPFVRYFSLNHLLTAGATPEQMELHRQALTKALNHLTWEKALVQPRSIDAAASVFAVDIRQLGWDKQPFRKWAHGKDVGRAEFNVFDLLLLEYPYGIFYEDSDAFERLTREFLVPTGQVRPIPFVRADWFASVATLPPLYHDLLQLPYDLPSLEKRLDVDADGNFANRRVRRAGLVVSGVSRNNRVVEYHPGGYWKSYDFRTGKTLENVLRDPIELRPAGGEIIFPLPNGLQGYFVVDAKGTRIDAAVTEIVVDKFASDQTVRNGLSCMRCHDQGMKGFADTVRPAVERLKGNPGFDRRLALSLYPEPAEMQKLLDEDGGRFRDALKKALGKAPAAEPLTPVSRRYLDGPISAESAAGELGLADPAALAAAVRLPAFTQFGLAPLGTEGVVRRDAWEDDFDEVVRNLGLGVPIVPIDGVTRREVSRPLAHQVVLRTNRKGNTFEPGDEVTIIVENRSKETLYIELTGTSVKGEIAPLTHEPVGVAPGGTYQYGPLKVKGWLGKEQITLYGAARPYPGGTLLRGKDLGDRFVHPAYLVRHQNKHFRVEFDAGFLFKKTIDVETR